MYTYITKYIQKKQYNKLHTNYDKINYTISDLERFNLGLFTDDFRFVCVHEARVCVQNSYKTITQNHKKIFHGVFT